MRVRVKVKRKRGGGGSCVHLQKQEDWRQLPQEEWERGVALWDQVPLGPLNSRRPEVNGNRSGKKYII